MSTPPLSWELALRECYGKRRFHARKHARDAASRMQHRSGTQGRVYHCGICGAYHLTSQSIEARKARGRRVREGTG